MQSLCWRGRNKSHDIHRLSLATGGGQVLRLDQGILALKISGFVINHYQVAYIGLAGRTREEAANTDLFSIFRQPDKSRVGPMPVSSNSPVHTGMRTLQPLRAHRLLQTWRLRKQAALWHHSAARRGVCRAVTVACVGSGLPRAQAASVSSALRTCLAAACLFARIRFRQTLTKSLPDSSLSLQHYFTCRSLS
jgi:hypothetical protein